MTIIDVSVKDWIRGKKFVVTGGAGFIGHHLVRTLLENEAQHITVIDDLSFGSEDFIPKNNRITFINFSIGKNDTEILRPYINKDTYVFHLAAQKHRAGERDHAAVWRSNVTGWDELLQLCGEQCVPQVIFTSSLYAYGKLFDQPMQETMQPAPHTAYGISKLAGEHLLKMYSTNFGFNHQIARLFFVYGPEQYYKSEYSSVIHKNIERIRAGQSPIVNGSGKQTLDYIYIDDVVRALLKLAQCNINGTLANIATGKGWSILDIIKKISQILKKEVEIDFAPADWTDHTNRVGNFYHINQICNWSPEIDFEIGLKHCIEE